MSAYVIGDIHGMYDDFIHMLSKINFDEDEDMLIFVGDYIDYGKQSYEIIDWLMNHQYKNYVTLRGDHEEDFILNVELLKNNSYDELRKDKEQFDKYNTIYDLMINHNFSIDNLLQWSNMFSDMPYLRNIHVNHKTYTIVHAGYTTSVDGVCYNSREDFYLRAKSKDVYDKCVANKRRVVMGHNVTAILDDPLFNDGEIKIVYDRKNRNIYYNIDCGCGLQHVYPNAKLGCMKLDDIEFYYI